MPQPVLLIGSLEYAPIITAGRLGEAAMKGIERAPASPRWHCPHLGKKKVWMVTREEEGLDGHKEEQEPGKATDMGLLSWSGNDWSESASVASNNGKEVQALGMYTFKKYF